MKCFKCITQKGFILFFVLVFLHIFSLLGLLSFANVSMNIKSRVHGTQKEDLLFKSNQILISLEKQLAMGTLACVMPVIAAAEISKKPFSWWQFNTCHGNLWQIHYYYGIEVLGSDLCGWVLEANHYQKQIASFYRITLLALPEKGGVTKIRLQSTMAIASKAMISCQSNSHQVMAGRQMWREI